MKVTLEKLLAFVLILSFICTGCPFGSVAAGEKISTVPAGYLKDNNFQVVAENPSLALYAEEKSGEFAVEDKRNHFFWYSNPPGRADDKLAQGVIKMDLSSQLGVTYTDFKSDQMKYKNNYTGSIKKKSAKLKKKDNGFTVIYKFPGEDGFSIPLSITLGEDYLTVEIDIDNLTETKHTIYSIDLLPYFGAGSRLDKGYIFVPDGSGALINFNNGKQSVEPYKEAIYGRDVTFASNQNPVKRQDIKLPVFGIKNGDNAFVAVVDKGESQGNIVANVSGIKSTYNNVYTSFDIRKYDSFTVGQSGMSVKTTRLFQKGKPGIGGCRIKYYFLHGPQADYSGMAKEYQQYLIKEKGLVPAAGIKPQMYLDLYGAVKKQKSIFGIPVNTVQPLTTYGDAIKILEELKKAGIDDVVLNYHDWSKDSVDSKIPTDASAIGKLGGDRGFKELCAYTNENNIKLYPQVDFLRILKGKFNFFKAFNETKTLGVIPAAIFSYKLSTFFKDSSLPEYSLLAPNSLGGVMSRFDKSYAKYELDTIGLDTISSLAYSDFSNSARSTRQESEAKLVDVLKQKKQQNESVAAAAPNAYVLPYIDYIRDVPSDSSNYYIEDAAIPFYEMVIRGIKPYTIEAFNFSADKSIQLLKAIETGANPHYTWIGQDPSILRETKYEGLYSAGYSAWMSSAIRDFKELSDIYSKIDSSKIDKHEKLAEKVFKTTYSNGTAIIVNYSDAEYRAGNTVVAPKRYLIMEGGN